MSKIVRNPLFIVAVLLSVPLVVQELQVAHWDGHYPLQVTLIPPRNQRVAEVYTMQLTSKEYGIVAPMNFKASDLSFERVDWVESEPFIVDVWCGGRTSGFGRELSYVQPDFLVLRIAFDDGEEKLIRVEIPDGRVSRAVTVPIRVAADDIKLIETDSSR